MILEAARIVADWLASGSGGSLTTLVPLVPRDGSDPLPAVPAVVDCTRDGQAARQLAPDTGLPVLQVLLQDTGMTERSPAVAPFPTDAELDLVLRLVYRAANTEQALRDSSYVIRAVRRSLRLLAVSAAGESARARGQIQLISVGETRSLAAFTPIGDATVTGGLIVTVRCRDLWAAAAA